MVACAGLGGFTPSTVVLPLMDTYENLTMKVMGMITYTAKCGEGDFYAKADDDVFVYPWRLKREFGEG